MDDKPRTLLIVDDSLIIRKAITKYIEDVHIEIVGTAHDGHSALEMFKSHKPDFVTLDISMPGLDGIHVLREMIKINPLCNVIIISALADKTTGLKALRSGAKSYIVKPFGKEKIQETFDRLINELDTQN